MSACKLTRSEILSSSDPYSTVADYVNEYVIEKETNDPPELSSPLRDVLAILEFDSEYQNGGIEQFFGNRTSDDGSLFPVVERAEKALARFGAQKLANLLSRAIVSWRELIEICGLERPVNSGELTAWLEEVVRRMDPLNNEMEQIYDESFSSISAYIRSHASDFCHG